MSNPNFRNEQLTAYQEKYDESGKRVEEEAPTGTLLTIIALVILPILLMGGYFFAIRFGFEVQNQAFLIAGGVFMAISAALLIGVAILFTSEIFQGRPYFPMRRYVLALIPGIIGYALVSYSLDTSDESCK